MDSTVYAISVINFDHTDDVITETTPTGGKAVVFQPRLPVRVISVIVFAPTDDVITEIAPAVVHGVGDGW